MAKIIDIEGIGPKYADKFIAIGIKTVAQLLKAGAQPKGREELAEKTGISKTLILEWVNHADLYRIKGVAEEYSDLLEEAGWIRLSNWQPVIGKLHNKIIEVNRKACSSPTIPKMVEDWILRQKIFLVRYFTKPKPIKNPASAGF